MSVGNSSVPHIADYARPGSCSDYSSTPNTEVHRSFDRVSLEKHLRKTKMCHLMPTAECSEPPQMFLPHVSSSHAEDITNYANQTRSYALIRHQPSQKDLGLWSEEHNFYSTLYLFYTLTIEIVTFQTNSVHSLQALEMSGSVPDIKIDKNQINTILIYRILLK